MKKAVFATITLSLVILGVCITNNQRHKNSETNDKTTIKIGATLPLTGEMAFVGKSVQKALELSLNDLKKEKELKYNYEFLFEDDGLDNKTAVMNFIRLTSMHDIKAMFSVWTSSSVVSDKNTGQTVHMGCSWGYETAQGYYNFNHSTFPKEQIAELIKEFKKHNIKKIGIIHNPIRADEQIIIELKKALNESNIEVGFTSNLNITQKDFRTEIVKIKEIPVDMVFVLLLSPSMEVYMKQSNELGYNPKYTTFDYFSYNLELFEGFWYIRDAYGSKDFARRFTAETGEELAACVANLYDGLKIMINGFESSSTDKNVIPNLKNVAGNILNSKDTGSAMEKSYIDEEGNIHTTPVVEIIKDGKSVSLYE